jgi:hypothetical protein
MIIQHENKAHAATCAAAEMTRQTGVSAAIAAGGNPASAIRTVEIAFYRSVIASCVANNIEAGGFRQALHDLGTGGT